MRKWLVLALLLVLVLPCAAQAESVTDALGITGEGGISAKGDLSARTETDLFVVMNDGEKKALVRVPRAGGEAVLVESADAISDLVAIGTDLYYLRTVGGQTTLARRRQDSSRSDVSAFKQGQVVRALSAFAENLYVIVDDEVHIVYPANGLLLKLVEVKMGDYAIAGDYLYYISLTDTLAYESDSLLGGDAISRSAGCLYRLNLKTGNSSLLIKTGVDTLECLDGALYFHNLSDHYVMGGEGEEWLEGRLYRFDLKTEQLARLVEGYDWGYYPTNSGVAVYTSENLSLYANDGALVRSLYAPEAYAVISGDAEVLVVYEPTDAKVTYVYPDGTVLDAYKGEPGAAEPEASATPSPFATEFPPLEDPNATEPAGETEEPEDDFTPADSNWLEGNTEAPSGTSTGGTSTGGTSSGGTSTGGTSTDDTPSDDTSSGTSSGGSYTTSSYGSGKKLTATASVNLRKGPGTGYAIVGSAAKGNTATCRGSAIDANGNRWYKVSYNGSSAWVYGKYVKLGSSSSSSGSGSSSTGSGKTIVATASVNLRKGPGLNYDVIASVGKGKTFSGKGSSVDSRGVRWYKVAYNGGTAWISSKYSKIGSSSGGSSSGGSTAGPETSDNEGKTVVTTASVNLRKGPSLNSAKVSSAKKGKTFTCKGTSTDSRGVKWYKVSYSGGTAWISSKYSKLQ